ncbi:hypothetical protein [Corynebacterium qintianiae]|uniref:hypothetical protein n=1 Tax=Corynebacterium qintianiae TaxID=2709392 RepID=UPI0013EAFD65|nr:hypothetical protein [Corynebacterium qintianiae]
MSTNSDRNPAEDTNDAREHDATLSPQDDGAAGTMNDDERIDESFPASDPPASYEGVEPTS